MVIDKHTTSQIESYMYLRPDWITTAQICKAFELATDRPLRQHKGTPGLCSGFAISGQKGFKQIAHATTKEWLTFKHRTRHHAIAELVRTSKLDKRRANLQRQLKHPPLKMERDTNQTLLSM